MIQFVSGGQKVNTKDVYIIGHITVKVMLALSYFISIGWSALITIDFGSYYTKAASLSEEGLPKIATNLDSKRLTPTFLAFRTKGKIEHEIGSRALDILRTKPWAGGGYFPALLDVKDRIVSKMSTKFGLEEKWSYGMTNMTAAFLHFYVEIVTGVAPSNVSSVIVVPGDFTIPQQEQLLQAATAAGLRQIQLLMDTTAIGFYYSTEKASSLTPGKNVLFIDVGATSVKAYVLQFEKKNGIDHIIRLSYEKNHKIGGAYATSLLADYILTKKLQLSAISTAERQRLFECSEKLKLQLSLLQTATVTLEDVGGKNYDITVTRNEFESVIMDMIIDAVDVVQRAIGTLMIDSVEIIGGSSRIPRLQQSIQRALSASLGIQKLGHSMNADEAVVLGGAYYSSGIKVFLSYRDNTTGISARADNQVHFVCNGSIGCANYVVLKQRPKSFTLFYDSRLDKRMKTRSWEVELPKPNASEVNLTCSVSYPTGQIYSIEQCTPSHCESFPQREKVDLQASAFVRELSAQYNSQKQHAEIFSSFENLLYTVTEKVVDEETINYRDDLSAFFSDSKWTQFDYVMKETRRLLLDENSVSIEEIILEAEGIEEFIASIKGTIKCSDRLKALQAALSTVEVLIPKISNMTEKSLQEKYFNESSALHETLHNRITTIICSEEELSNFVHQVNECIDSLEKIIASITKKPIEADLSNITGFRILLYKWRTCVITLVNRYQGFFKLFEL